jgi:hypothetical protein
VDISPPQLSGFATGGTVTGACRNSGFDRSAVGTVLDQTLRGAVARAARAPFTFVAGMGGPAPLVALFPCLPEEALDRSVSWGLAWNGTDLGARSRIEDVGRIGE